MYDYRPKIHKTRKHRELEQYIRFEFLDFQENNEEHLYDLEEDLYETLCSSCTSIAVPYYRLNLDIIFDANRTKRQKATSSRKSKNDHGYCSPDKYAIYVGTKEQIYRQTPL
eukprot:CAMPEP_0176501828 /NCGR_PEP_ID=MMETSP0200_2-20121128/14398_1 /TAXON_ID=947934 /ORGANISM="Chaetoceros sp., Strain GSL56" /LENGTH=111 /DNA_ID=CAMNT_0017900799 /DNA_START=1440 /DNA_END=1775 /DNA_ORIENTATION=-